MYTEEHNVAVVYVDDCQYRSLKIEVPEKAPDYWTEQMAAENTAAAILKAWLVLTGEEADLAEDEDDEDDWSVISVHGNATIGTWMAICAPYRGEHVQFMFFM